MSTATAATAINHELSRHPTWPKPEPLRLKILEWGGFVLVGGFLFVEARRTLFTIEWDAFNLPAWLIAVAITDLLYVPLWGTTLAMSLPILLAAAMLFPPVVAGLLALLATTDVREFRREVTIARSLFNRCQIALSVMASSWIFHGAGGDLSRWPRVLALALMALAADSAVNFVLLSFGWRAAGMGSVREGALRIFGREPLSFALSYVGFGLMAVPLAVVYQVVGAWGLLAFVIPIVLGHQAFVNSERLREMAEKVSEKTTALRTVSVRIADERRDERLAVAAELHDELLPPLYKVHLMGQVLRQDLAMGRLLNLEEDVPELLGATEQASEATQGLIRDLRHSRLGSDGLVGTIHSLVRDMETAFPGQIQLEVEDVGGSPIVQLLAYQILREALRNAVRHAHASHIQVSLSREGPDMRITVEDNGQGFDPKSVDTDRHFGLLLIRERVELAGGVLNVRSWIGEGTRVIARLPSETSSESN